MLLILELSVSISDYAAMFNVMAVKLAVNFLARRVWFAAPYEYQCGGASCPNVIASLRTRSTPF